MLWFYFMALILLIGFELNVSIWSAQSKANAEQASVFASENSTFNTEK
jgi:uncharacterized BrkB/YihY/UPF0761 family membrane protein